jgi:hypothetical protein
MSTFDAALFVADIEGMGASLRAVRLQNRKMHMSRSYPSLANLAVNAKIDALWNKEMTSPERLQAVAEFLLKRQNKEWSS